MRRCATVGTFDTDDFVHSLVRRIEVVGVTSDAQTPRSLARRVIASGGSHSTTGDGASAAAVGACGYLYNELSRWIGSEGCHALFTRALADARKESQPLQSIQLSAGAVPYVQGVETTIDAHGDAETAAGIETLLIRLVELLGRLIGDDMAMKLIEPVLAKSANGREKPETGR